MHLFIVIVTYKKPIEEVDAHLSAHKEFLGKHYESGRFIVSGRQVPRTDGGLIVSKGTSKEEVLNLLREDPFQKEGIADYQVIELEPTRSAEGFQQFME